MTKTIDHDVFAYKECILIPYVYYVASYQWQQKNVRYRGIVALALIRLHGILEAQLL